MNLWTMNQSPIGAICRLFTGDGLRIDCSVHAMVCPVPSRIANNWPDARLIICLREPVSRTALLNMILDTEADKKNG